MTARRSGGLIRLNSSRDRGFMFSNYSKVRSSFKAPQHAAALETRPSARPEANGWFPMCCRLIDRTNPI